MTTDEKITSELGLSKADESADIEKPLLSKRQQKKILEKARWEANAEARREARKLKTKARKERKRAQREENPQDKETKKPMTDPRKLSALIPPSPIRIVVDCDFDEKMFENEINSLQTQLTRCHSSNQRAKPSCHLLVSGFGKRLQQRMDLVFKDNYRRWRLCEFSSLDFVNYFKQSGESTDKIVYLTGDSPNVLEELDPDEIYVVGGIVDRNREKNLCLNKANELGLRHAKLPIGEYLQLTTRKILTTNHVVEILLQYLETKEWKQSLLNVIPKRKKATEIQ